MFRILICILILSGCSTTISQQSINEMSIEDVQVLADKKNPLALHALCYRYMYGYNGAEKNYETAYSWCGESAENDNNSSITLLAEMFYLGNFVEKDLAKAFQLYQQAALSGHSHAQLMMHLMNKSGEGTRINLELANFWLELSAKNGNKQAIRIVSQTAI